VNLTATQIKVLRIIQRGRGMTCRKGYRFNSAAVLARTGLITGDSMTPYWTWGLTDKGRKVLRIAKRDRAVD
jgi:hypothetical protein